VGRLVGVLGQPMVQPGCALLAGLTLLRSLPLSVYRHEDLTAVVGLVVRMNESGVDDRAEDPGHRRSLRLRSE